MMMSFCRHPRCLTSERIRKSRQPKEYISDFRDNPNYQEVSNSILPLTVAKGYFRIKR